MPFTHHSHSGQFCLHAENRLEDMAQAAIEKGFVVFAMTEHMPRYTEHFYPRELVEGETEASVKQRFQDFVSEASRLRQGYGHQLHMPIGFEGEFCDSRYANLIRDIIETYGETQRILDFFIGSLHHVHTVPIDHDRAEYEKARALCGGEDHDIQLQYFREQMQMLKETQPPVVGHFDLIRLFGDEPDADWKDNKDVWRQIIQNLDYIMSYGGILEINTAALRKGLAQPYPRAEICDAFLTLGGRFCLSDDSHSIYQVATNYNKLHDFLESARINTLCFIKHSDQVLNISSRFPCQEIVEVRRDSLPDAIFKSAL